MSPAATGRFRSNGSERSAGTIPSIPSIPSGASFGMAGGGMGMMEAGDGGGLGLDGRMMLSQDVRTHVVGRAGRGLVS